MSKYRWKVGKFLNFLQRLKSHSRYRRRKKKSPHAWHIEKTFSFSVISSSVLCSPTRSFGSARLPVDQISLSQRLWHRKRLQEKCFDNFHRPCVALWFLSRRKQSDHHWKNSSTMSLISSRIDSSRTKTSMWWMKTVVDVDSVRLWKSLHRMVTSKWTIISRLCEI